MVNTGSNVPRFHGSYDVERRSRAEREYDQAVAAARAELHVRMAAKGLNSYRDVDAAEQDRYAAARDAAWQRLLAEQPDGYR